jgi:hypothetical protein
MGAYGPEANLRVMKVQEVILRAVSGQMSWLDAADVLRWSPRTLRRWRRRYERYGYDGLFDRRRRGTVHRMARERRPLRGMLVYVDGSTHAWLSGQTWKQDLIGFVDDATGEVYEVFLCPEEGSAFVPAGDADLDGILCVVEERVVNNDNTVSWHNRKLQIPPVAGRHTLAKCRVRVCEHVDGRLSLRLGPRPVAWFDAQRRPLQAKELLAA